MLQERKERLCIIPPVIHFCLRFNHFCDVGITSSSSLDSSSSLECSSSLLETSQEITINNRKDKIEDNCKNSVTPRNILPGRLAQTNRQ